MPKAAPCQSLIWGEALGQHAVDDREADREGEVDDEGDPGESFVTVEGVGQVGDALRDTQLLEQLLGAGLVALRSGVRGGSGTSQPNFTMAETIPPRTPASAATP